jgi:hypothetical protein
MLVSLDIMGEMSDTVQMKCATRTTVHLLAAAALSLSSKVLVRYTRGFNWLYFRVPTI